MDKDQHSLVNFVKAFLFSSITKRHFDNFGNSTRFSLTLYLWILLLLVAHSVSSIVILANQTIGAVSQLKYL